MYEVEVLVNPALNCLDNAFYHFEKAEDAMNFVLLSIANGYEICMRFVEEED